MADDLILLHSLKAGDPAALAALFDAHADRIYRLALGLLEDPLEAEDVVQDTFVKAITFLELFEGRSSLSTWLYRIAYNVSIDRLRQRVESPIREEELDRDEDLSIPMPKLLIEWHTPESFMIGDEDSVLLEQAIRQLPEHLRIVFVLRDIEELSTAETAEVVGISASSVKVRLHRARLLLRELLAAHFAQRQTDVG